MIRKFILALFILLILILTLVLAVYFFVLKKPHTSSQFIFPAQQTKLFEIDTSSFIDIDYGKQIATGSPLIFGGAHAPNLEHQDAWDKIAEVGVTAIRRDFYIENELPTNITLNDYKNNINNITNPENWNQKNIQSTNQIYQNAKERGMKVMGILSFTPAWLTYSGKTKGVPKDWDVYEDIVKKVYKLHRNYIDYLEIWNEPDYKLFLDLKNTPYSKEEAYALIYFYAQKAVREVDQEINDGKEIPIGAIIVSNPTDIAFFESVLSKIIITSRIDFISYHNYGHLSEPSWIYYKDILNKYGKSNIPIYLTEWNAPDIYKTSRYTNLAISYTGSKLISFLNMGLPMADYYAMLDLNRSKNPNDDPSFAFYIWEDGKAKLLPQAKTWRLLSVSLGLGKGESKIFNTQYAITNTILSLTPSTSNAVGFEDIFGKKGLAVVNDEDEEIVVNVTMINSQIKPSLLTRTEVDVYVANMDDDGGSVVENTPVEAKNGKIQFKIKLPAQSVVGVLLRDSNILKEIFNSQ